MDFFVYDNVMTYNKLNPFNGAPNTRIEVDHIELPENGSFWFFTDMQLVQDNVNIQQRYVHIHPGIGSTNNARFQKPPHTVKRSEIIYNPKTHRVEVKTSILPWKKPIFAKICKYYGAELPSKKMTLVGEWYFNFGNKSMHFIINYMPQKLKFHWEEEEEQYAEFEQMMRIEELEEQIKIAEETIRINNRLSRFVKPVQTVDS